MRFKRYYGVLGLALATLSGADIAYGADECGSGTNVTCTSAGNFFVNGITYNNANQTVSMSSGVVVNAGANLGVHLAGSGTQTLNIAPGVAISNTGSNDGIDIDGATSIILNGAGSSVATTGNFAWGLGLVSTGAIDATLGSVSVGGNGAIGIFAQAGGPIDITTGNITATGSNLVFSVNAISATATGAGASGAITIDTSGGTVSLTGATTSHALNVVSGNVAGGGAVSITTANVSTVSANANAINATTNGTGTNGAMTIDTTAGTITTSGAGSRGISASSTAAANSGLVTVNAANVTTTGTGAAHAIFASSTSGAVTVTAGNLSTSGVGALGVSAAGRGIVNVTTDDVGTSGANAHGIQATSSLAGAPGLTTVDSTGGTITTLGTGARGVSIESAAGADAVVQAGGIDTTGDNAAGVHVVNNTNGGAITVTADSIVTRGNTTSMLLFAGADGVQALTSGTGAAGRITIDTSASDDLGSVETTGAGSYGIRARTAGGAVDVTAGSVVTHGAGATGIAAESSGIGVDGNVTVTTFGLVSTTGSADSQGTGDAINAVSFGSGDVVVTTADVSTAGGSARGVFAQSSGGAVTIDTTGGTVSTTGVAGFGIIGTFNGTSGPVSITTGDVHTEGNLAIAIGGFSGGPDADLTIDTTAGAITTSGTNATGINAVTSSISLPANAGTLEIDAGDISTLGDGSSAIFASAKGGAIDIDVIGELSTAGAGSRGVSARNQNAATTTITINNTITTTGSAAHGVQSDAIGTGTTIVTVNDAISATGTDARGILITGTGDEVTINAAGSVTGFTAAVDMQQLGTVSVINDGTVTGTGGTAVRFLGAFASTFDNSGTFNGSILMGAGDDLVVLDTTSVANGALDGQTDTDTLRLHGTGSASLDVANILNFEFGEKTEIGTWTLTGSNATLATAFDVQGGTLVANAVAAGLDVTVDGGARLGGGGTIGDVTVGSNATLAPGNSIGTLNVATATLAANSILEIEIDPTSSDLLSASGLVTIDSTAMVSVIAPTGAYTDAFEYLIVDAGTRSGTFGGVIDNSAFLDFTLDHDKDPDQVWLRIALVATFPDVAETPNQLAAATALEELAPGNSLFDAIVLLDEDEARNAFDLASGEIHASAQSALIEDSRFVREATLYRARQPFDATPGERTAFAGPGATPESDAALSLWGRTFGSWCTIDGDGNAARLERDTGGFFGGLDTVATGWLRLGVTGGIQHSDIAVAARNSKAGIDSYHLAAFAAAEWSRFALRAGGAITWHDLDTSRRVVFPGFDEVLHANYDARTKQAFAEAALPLRIGGAELEPFVSFTHLAISTDSFAERSGVAALNVAARDEDVDFTTVGLRLAETVVLGGDRVRLSTTVAWRHLLDDDFRPFVVNAFAGGTPFLISGVPLAQDTLKLDAGADFYLGDDVKLSLSYSGEFADGLQDHGAVATLTIAF